MEAEEVGQPSAGAVEKAIMILQALGEFPGGAGVSVLARRLEMGKGTVHRILQSLTETGMAAYIPGSRSYQLGGRALQLGLLVLERIPLRYEARPTMERLRDITGESTALLVRAGDRIVTIERTVTQKEPKRVVGVGQSYHKYAGTGAKTFLAFGGEYSIDTYVASEEFKLLGQDEAEFREEMREIRSRGYAISHSESIPNTQAIFFPVINVREEVLGVISIFGPADRFGPTNIAAVIDDIKAATFELSQRVRYMDPIFPGGRPGGGVLSSSGGGEGMWRS